MMTEKIEINMSFYFRAKTARLFDETGKAVLSGFRRFVPDYQQVELEGFGTCMRTWRKS